MCTNPAFFVIVNHARERTENNGKTQNRRIDTTLGELIAAASEVAFEYSDNDKDAYNLAQFALDRNDQENCPAGI